MKLGYAVVSLNEVIEYVSLPNFSQKAKPHAFTKPACQPRIKWSTSILTVHMHLGWHTILTCFENREMYLLSGQEIKSKNSLILSRPLAIFKIKDILLKVQKHTQKKWLILQLLASQRVTEILPTKTIYFYITSGFPSVSEASKIPCCLSRDESGK